MAYKEGLNYKNAVEHKNGTPAAPSYVILRMCLKSAV